MTTRFSSVLPVIVGAVFGGLSSFALLTEEYAVLVPPLFLAVLYCMIQRPSDVFISLAFFVPLSINIEEYSDNFGLFIPTEPILLSFLLILAAYQLRRNLIEGTHLKSWVMFFLFLYLSWLFITSIVSSNPFVSFKFILARLWYVVPCLVFGPIFFSTLKSIKQFFWLYLIGTSIVVVYTVFNHATYAFGEKESHWVMAPFFKDHTIYGAILALVTPFPVMLLLVDKGSLLKRVVLVSLMIIILIGLYFSYTRAAWLSVFGAGLILIVVLSKVKFAYVFGALSLLIIFLLGNVDVIQMELARNKEEHTTEDFNKRLQSATNVTTDASNLERINRWTCAIEMAKERPFFGFGPGTYAFEYARFQDPENLTIISTNFGDLGNAHSEYLSALSETGIIGLVLFVAFIGSYFYYLIRIVQEARHQNQAIYIIACGILFSQTTYFIHAVLNNFLDTDKAAFPIYSMMAITFVLKQFLSTKPQGGVERSGIYPADSVNFEM